MAGSIFKRAGMLKGFYAWRRLVGHMGHGKDIRLEQLRREVKTMDLTPIKELEWVESGIADFENTLGEYVRAGGAPFKDIEEKSDLLAILPSPLGENPLRQASDKCSFYQFRGTVLSQTAKVLVNRRTGALNNITGDEFERRPRDDHHSEQPAQPVQNFEGLIAAFNRFAGKQGG